MPRNQESATDYINSLSSEVDPILAVISDNQSSWQKAMQLEKYEGKLVYILLEMIAAKNVLEIGMLNGYSTIWIANAVKKRDGIVYTIEKNQDYIDAFLKIAHTLSHNIKCIHGDAHEVLKDFTDPMDAIFIDADKNGYIEYFMHAKRLLKPGGILIVDNVFLYGNVYGASRKKVSQKSIAKMQKFNLLVSQDPDFQTVIIPTMEGLMVARNIKPLSKVYSHSCLIPENYGVLYEDNTTWRKKPNGKKR